MERLRYFLQLPKEVLRPKLLTVLREGVSRQQLRRDLVAGLIVGVVALPLAIAFAIASGVTPDKGLITAVVAGFLVSALSGSRVQIGGPTGAFIPIVYGIVQQYGIDGLIVSTFLAGIMLALMGLAKLGSVIKFIPHSLIVGFTTGIAVIIFSSQIKDFLGLPMGAVPADFIEKWAAYAEYFGQINPWAAGLAAATVAITFLMPKISTKVPGALVAIVLFTAIVGIFHLPVETIESRFGAIPSTLPAPVMPNVNWASVQHLIRPAFTIALLCAIESLLCAVVADSMIGSTHRSNTELVAQGAANMASAVFGGIPATGAIARTATNVKNGGRTPFAGIFHALVLLIIMFFAGRWAQLIPLSVLAGILVYVAYNMSEWRTFRAIARGQRADVVVLLTTFFLTVLFDLTVAIEIGMVLAAFLFMRRMAKIGGIQPAGEELSPDDERDDPESLRHYPLPVGVQVFEVSGPLFFGVAHTFKEAMRRVSKSPRVLILRMRYVPTIDETGIHHLREFIHNLHARDVKVLFSGVGPVLYEELKEARIIFLVGKKNVLPGIGPAVERAKELLAETP